MLNGSPIKFSGCWGGRREWPGRESRLWVRFGRGDGIGRRIRVGIGAGKGRYGRVESWDGAALQWQRNFKVYAAKRSHCRQLLRVRATGYAAGCLHLPELADEQSFQPLAPVFEGKASAS